MKGDQVWFSEVSPRPHDTGLVTLISQDLSQFALHARAILGLPIPAVRQFGPSASAVILPQGQSQQTSFANLGAALSEPDTAIRLFGKPEINGTRRMGVCLARTSRSSWRGPRRPSCAGGQGRVLIQAAWGRFAALSRHKAVPTGNRAS